MTDISKNEFTQHLDQVTGLSWSPPPAQPNFLKNGYHTELSLVEAPRLVRRLQAAATRATGRPRAIVFQSLGRGVAVVNVPREVAEGRWFLQALAQDGYGLSPELAALALKAQNIGFQY